MMPLNPDLPPTRWSLIAILKGDDSEKTRAALEQLCQNYWYPLYAYIRRTGRGPEDAADLTQGFFAHLVTKEVFAQADPERGRLRNYLLASLQRFLRDDWRKQSRHKRGYGAVPLSIDEVTAEGLYTREPAHVDTPEKLYHRRWALTLLERSVLRLQADYAQQGKAELFEALKPTLAEEPDASSSAQIGDRLGMTSGAVRVAVSRLRTRYRAVLTAELAAEAEVLTEADVDEEISALFRALS